MRVAFIISILFSSAVYAAPSRLESLHEVLSKPLPTRVQAAKKFANNDVKDLQKIAFSDIESLEDRWRAVTLLGRTHPAESRELLEKALQSKEWFMRNAAVTVLNYSDREWAIRWLRILMHDPALVVRTSVVAEIREIGAIEAQDLLWEKLYSTENFRGGQSLWIRKHIVETLAQFGSREREADFGKLLYDKDTSLRPLALSALRKMGSIMGEGGSNIIKAEN